MWVLKPLIDSSSRAGAFPGADIDTT